MKIAAAIVALILVLAFGSFKQQDAPLTVTCGSVSGGTAAIATGVEWARKLGGWIHEVSDNPEQYRDPQNIKRTFDGVFNQVLWYWLRTAYLSARGEKIDPQILQLEQDAAKQAAAEDACTPCPTADDAPDDGSEPPVSQASASSGNWTQEQAAITKTTIAVGKSMGVPLRGWVVAITAGKTETGLRNLSYGHSSSVGVWQLIQTHGTVAQRTNVEFSARWFFRQLKAVEGWESMPIGQASQAVERSAYPDRYAPNEAWARNLVASFSDEPPAADEPTPEPPQSVQCITADQEQTGTVMAAVAGTRTIKEPTSGVTYQIPIPKGPRGVAINFALDQAEEGDWYQWGAHGPDRWDCSGLLAGAWGKAGVTLIPQSEQMRRTIPLVSKAQPGDLLYKPGHIQMALGRVNGQTLIVEAPRTGSRMRIRPQWMTPTAVLDPTKLGAST